MTRQTTPNGAVPRGWLERLARIGDRRSDDADARLRHRLLIYTGLLMSVGGLVWGGLAAHVGAREQAAIPFAYSAATALNLTYFKLSKNFTRVRFVQILLSLLLPFAFQWSLGGFVASGAVALWAMLAIVAALTFTGRRTIVKWLVSYSALVIASGAFDPALSGQHGGDVSAAFFVINIVLISNITFGLTLYLITQRHRVERALASAQEQIVDLEQEVRSARQLGQYTLEQKLGEGGMGEVYRASHALLRRPTAIKLLPAGKVGESSIRRFEQEVQLTAQLTHPNTITVFDYGRTPEGVFYYAMELLDGATVEDIVRADGPQPIARVIHVLEQAADALSEAHAAGLIHRDVKPANLVLCPYGGKLDHVKVLDFGLVRTTKRDGAAGITADGMVAGTPAYLAPEALTSPSLVDHRSDLYALGALGYFMLTGTTPFSGDTAAAICAHHIYSRPVPPSARRGEPIPERLEALVLACLAKRPSDRPRDAAAVVSALASIDVPRWTQRDARAWWLRSGDELDGLDDRDAAIDRERGGGAPTMPSAWVRTTVRMR